MSEVLAYLQDKGLRIRQAGPNDVHVPCWYCNEDETKRGRLYINVGSDETEGLHFCHLCGTRGNFITMQRHFGDEPRGPDSDGDHARVAVNNAATEFYVNSLESDHVAWLVEERGLQTETIRRHRLGWACGGTDLYDHLKTLGFSLDDMKSTGLVVERDGVVRDFLEGEITIPYQVNGNVQYVRGKRIGGKYRTPPGAKTRLFNSDATFKADEIVVCEGEFDALIAEQYGYAAVGVPGANIWQDNWRGYFTAAKRVYVVFDPDDAGRAGAIKLEGVIGDKVKVVDLPIPQGASASTVDVSSLATKHGMTQDGFTSLLRSALVANSVLVSVDDAFEEWEGLQGVDGLKTGYDHLDLLIRPGLLPGQVAVVLAKTNTGKTLALLNLFQRLSMVPGQEDHTILFCSLEQTRGDWFERARRIWNFYNLECDPDEVNTRTLQYWRTRLLLTDKNRISRSQLEQALEEYSLRMGKPPSLLAVDYLGYFAAGYKGSQRYEKVSDAIMDLKGLAKDWRIPLVTPHQVSRSAEFGEEPSIDDARDSGAVEETADFMFTLWSPDTVKGKSVEEHTGAVNLRIGKSRAGGKGELVRMLLAKCTLALVPVEDTRVRLCRDEVTYVRQGDTWQQAIWRHRTGDRTTLYVPSVHASA